MYKYQKYLSARVSLSIHNTLCVEIQTSQSSENGFWLRLQVKTCLVGPNR
jgi:hypothetical protein